jgi:hypothetical protein
LPGRRTIPARQIQVIAPALHPLPGHFFQQFFSGNNQQPLAINGQFQIGLEKLGNAVQHQRAVDRRGGFDIFEVYHFGQFHPARAGEGGDSRCPADQTGDKASAG